MPRGDERHVELMLHHTELACSEFSDKSYISVLHFITNPLKIVNRYSCNLVSTHSTTPWSNPLPWASGLPVAIQCAWNLDPSVHWNATGEMPVCFQWSSSGFPVVFQCVPIMQINTGSPLEHHWVLASASVVPMASQCTCDSSGLPMCSNYAN